LNRLLTLMVGLPLVVILAGIARNARQRFAATVVKVMCPAIAVLNTMHLVNVYVMIGGGIVLTTTAKSVTWKDTRFNMQVNDGSNNRDDTYVGKLRNSTGDTRCPLCVGLWSPFPCPYDKKEK
jgi:hypothetical protein